MKTGHQQQKPFARVTFGGGGDDDASALEFFGLLSGEKGDEGKGWRWAGEDPEHEDEDPFRQSLLLRARFLLARYRYSPADGYPGVQHVYEVAGALGGKAEILAQIDDGGKGEEGIVY